MEIIGRGSRSVLAGDKGNRKAEKGVRLAGFHGVGKRRKGQGNAKPKIEYFRSFLGAETKED